MASITIRNLSQESKERLRRRASQRGCSLEALVRSILDGAAEETVVSTGFPHDLIAVIEPGEELPGLHQKGTPDARPRPAASVAEVQGLRQGTTPRPEAGRLRR